MEYVEHPLCDDCAKIKLETELSAIRSERDEFKALCVARDAEVLRLRQQIAGPARKD